MSVFSDRNGPLCIVQGCLNGFQSNTNIQYFPMPVHTIQIALAWYKNTMRTDLRPSPVHHVCEQHFEESCFEQGPHNRKLLRLKSLPTLFDLEVFYKMIAYQESNKTIKKTNITFHTSNPEIDGKTLEPILKLNSASEHIKTRLAPTNNGEQDERENQPTLLSTSDHFETRASNRCHVDGCIHNYVARRHRVQLYKISRDPQIARKWLDACGFESIAVSPSTATFKVCREHFTPNDFEGPATLRFDAVPSQFTAQSRALIERNNPSSSFNKRFRGENGSKPAINVLSNKRQSPTDRSNVDIDLTQSPPSSYLQSDESFLRLGNDSKSMNDIELTMICIEEPLSEVQLKRNAVKALDRTENNTGLIMKPKNPVGRPRIHPRQPPLTSPQPAAQPVTGSRRSINTDDDFDESELHPRKRDREWINGHQDERSSRPNYHEPIPTRPTMTSKPVNIRESSSIKLPINRGQEERLDPELEQSYKRSLSKFYGQKSGRNCPLSDYGDYRSRCHLCEDALFENNIQLIIHLAQHYKSSSNSNSPFEQINTKCSYCHSEFSNPYFLAIHIDDKHWNEMNVYPCRICEENHSSVSQLIKHLTHQHGGLDMPYTCQLCSFRTSIYGDMIYHIDETHKSTRYFFCQYCLLAIELPLMTINNTKILNGALAYEHLSLHWKSIEQNRTNQCHRCLLHVSSIREHLQNDHAPINQVNKQIYHHQKFNHDGREFFDQSTVFNERSSNNRFLTSTKHA